ncbi:MAG TPA: septal ring lytic transglycosylase RlpA family protein [Solirubrobacteraceae bacterium]|jgi:rare lipoprotein A|nr:septal ring lytic transglycosylase RlpA family protein [Solirubrobacteraceae bacterium]
MQTAFAKHAPRANLRSYARRVAVLSLWAVLALPASAGASTATTGGAAAKSAAVEPASSEGSTASGATSSTGSATTSGGAAPGEAFPKRTLATWFGPGFYGNKTACGQTMSPTLVGVASRTLACGTLVQIGYRGHRLTVPVIDRGPYGHIGAMWDLTAGTARALNIKETVRVTTAVVGSVPNSPMLGEPAEASPPSAPAAAAPATATASTGGAAAAS